jgi:DNA topoisomerase-2
VSILFYKNDFKKTKFNQKKLNKSCGSVMSSKVSKPSYVSLDQRTHVLHRPDMYIGNVKNVVMDFYGAEYFSKEDNKEDKKEDKLIIRDDDDDSEKDIFISKKRGEINSGLHRIFIEVLSNAIDNVWRSSSTDTKCTKIKVDITEKGMITVWNDGLSIPVEVNEETGLYNPEMIFGKLLTSSNYDDNEERMTSGRNGAGSKCLGQDVIVPLFSGKNTKAKDVKMGDILIGDDGTPRKINNIIKGTGKMYEVSQSLGESYIVNEEHILTLHMPDHKVIFWNTEKKGWSVLWWNKKENKINSKSISAYKPEISCPECGIKLCGNLNRHYKRIHKELKPPKKDRKSPITNPVEFLNNSEEVEKIEKARLELEEFCKSIDDDNTFDISVKDYINLNKFTQNRLAGVRGKCVVWEKKEVLIDPYILGLWLGDGDNTGYGFTSDKENDPEVMDYIEEWGKSNDCNVKKGNRYHFGFSSISNFRKRGYSPLTKLLKNYNLFKNKHIPQDYLINDRETRLKVLAGIIDTDGTVQRDGTRISISQGMNHEQLTKDIIYLTRSLGLCCHYTIKKTSWRWKGELKKGLCYNINISGNGVQDIPTRIFRKKCNPPKSINTSKTTGIIRIKDIGDGDFVGFDIDGNKRFVINDFTVTHNCTNVFSKEFSVKLFDTHTGHQYVQSWKNNMSEKDKPKITSPKQKNGYTQISFLPDFEKFGVSELSKDMKSIFFKNIVDTAMITGIQVYYNGNKIPVKSMKDYAMFYYNNLEEDDKDNLNMVYIESSDSKVVLCPNLKNDGFSQISFVNGIETFHGGIHVDTWTNAILSPVLEKINSSIKKGGSSLTLRDIKSYFRIFIKCDVPNPSFSSQEKSYLNSPNVSQPNVENKNINAIMKWSVIDKIRDMVKGKELNALKKIEKKKGFVKIEGLDPANLAGSKNSQQCSLILCEGDSAKTFAVKGIQTGVGGRKGRDYFGIYPLRGKVLNVRNSNVASITKNKEIGDIIKALNLKYGVDYKDDDIYDSLYYGRIIILTDSDVDGYHICGLLLNFFHKLFPSLIERNPSFITCMRTPIVRIYYPKTDIAFYTLEDFKKYQEQNPNKKGDVKYFKGLGTNNNKEIETSFGKKMIEFVKDDKTDDTMDKVFSSKCSDQRKTWLRDYNPSKDVELVSKNPVQLLGISDFLDKEMIKFSIDDCKRSIPGVMDGLKESQRKILYATFIKNLKNSGKTMKVAQLAGFVAEKTNYHHGEQCLFETITKLAHDFVGSNNIPLLYRDGQFGGRIAGGKDAANARYIYTKLDVMTRLIFREEDDDLLVHLYDDGDKVEPIYFVPIIPMILVNGCTAGIGTGWSSQVPCYNPTDIIREIREWLYNKDNKIDEDEEKEENQEKDMIPWYRGFNGVIEKVSRNKYITKGLMEKKMVRNVSKIIVNELPIYLWIDKFKESVEDLVESKKIKGYKNNSSDVVVSFELDEIKDTEFECNEDTLGLTATLSTNNMVLFNNKGEITKYESVYDILNEFCGVRYEFYVKRREYIISDLSHCLLIVKNKMRFLKEVMDESLIIKDVDEDVLIKEMQKRGYYKNDKNDNDYGYMLNMNIRSFTKQKLLTLEKEIEDLENKLDIVKKTSPSEMWLSELNELEQQYRRYI